MWLKKILENGTRRNSSQSVLIQITPKTEKSFSTLVNTSTLNSTIQVVTVPKQMLSNSSNQIIIVNSTSFDNANLSTSDLVNSPLFSCSTQMHSCDFSPLPRPIMCVDGNNATPTCTSDSDTPDLAPPPTTTTTTGSAGQGLGAGCKNIA